MLRSLPPARRRVVLAALTLALLGVVAIVVVAVSGHRSDDRPTANQSTPGPILLVPGYGGSTGGLDDLAAVLRAHGRDVTVVRLPGNGEGDLDTQARTLNTDVDAVLRRTHASTVDVVGYSAGGVVPRLWVRDHGGAAKTRRVLTLGSPQHGTSLAALAGSVLPGACPTACRQLATDSTLLAGLNAGDETPAGPTWVSLWTTRDKTVVPPSSASLSGALDLTVQSVCPDDTVDHGGLPTDHAVQSLVVGLLAAGPPVRPTRCPTD